MGGPAAHLLGYARLGELRLDVSDPILDETVRVLRDKFHWSGEMLHYTRQKLLGISNRVAPRETLDIIKEDPPDNRILECAAAARSDFIISEDKDLLRLGSFNSAQITTIRNFFERKLIADKSR